MRNYSDRWCSPVNFKLSLNDTPKSQQIFYTAPELRWVLDSSRLGFVVDGFSPPYNDPWLKCHFAYLVSSHTCWWSQPLWVRSHSHMQQHAEEMVTRAKVNPPSAWCRPWCCDLFVCSVQSSSDVLRLGPCTLSQVQIKDFMSMLARLSSS